jgi:DGQHR domain-containing protein
MAIAEAALDDEMSQGLGRRWLKLNALRIEQRKGVPLYVFGVNGRLVHQFASVQAAQRSADGVLVGYQRTRVARHIAEIFSYLSSQNAVLPNAIVLALEEEATFEPAFGALRNEWGTPGCLQIPLPEPGESKPCVIVDGQQRVSALAQLDPKKHFPVVVVAFKATSEDLQREQFVLVNKTKPLPRDLLNELLPHVSSELPKAWQLRRVASEVVELLRFDGSSPFVGRIRGLGSGGEGCNISQAAVLDVVETSIRRGGVLSPLVSKDRREFDSTAMARVLSVFYTGVARVWPYAWNESPRTSRLVHGVGISALGRLMDLVMTEVDATSPRATSSVERRLRKISRRCAWTEGEWPAPLRMPWQYLENTAQDKRRLADYLISEYRKKA